jgi:hypothetical protein
MKQILVYDDKKNVTDIIQFDGKQIVCSTPFMQELIDNDWLLPKKLPDRFEMIPTRFSNLSRMIVGDIKGL